MQTMFLFSLLQAGGNFDGSGISLPYFIAMILAALVLWYVFGARSLEELTGRCTYLDKRHISGKELFEKIQGEIAERHLPVRADIKSMFEEGVASKRREYLRLTCMNSQIDVSVGFFGDGSYVAWHLLAMNPTLFNRIPVISTLRGKSAKYQSYFQADTMASFQAVIRDLVDTEVQAFAETQGIRPLAGERLQLSRKSKRQMA